MNPASAINCGAARSISQASAASNASRLEKRRCSTSRVATPRAAAVSRPLASASLLITVVIGSPASINACRLLPRPEMSTATDMSRSVDPRRSVAVCLEQREHTLVSIQVQRALRLHRELIEGEDLFLNLLDLQKRNAAGARECEQLDIERRTVLPGGAAQVEEHAPRLEPVDEFGRQPDRLQVLHRALEVLR